MSIPAPFSMGVHPPPPGYFPSFFGRRARTYEQTFLRLSGRAHTRAICLAKLFRKEKMPVCGAILLVFCHLWYESQIFSLLKIFITNEKLSVCAQDSKLEAYREAYELLGMRMCVGDA